MLTNSQYNTVERIYEERRSRSRALRDARNKELRAKFPVIAEIDEKIVSGSIKAGRLAIAGDTSELQKLKEANGRLIENKQYFLVSMGYSADYLDDVYECPKCKDTGRIEGKKCECFYRTVIDCFYLDDNRRKKLEQENFKNFDPDLFDDQNPNPDSGYTDSEIATDAVRKSKEMIAQYGTGNLYDVFDDGKFNLLITGKVGAGKTFLANCLAKEMLDRNLGVLYLTAVDFFGLLRNLAWSHDDDDDSDAGEILDSADCLIIDDLGTENTTAFSSSQLFALLEKRQLKGKPVIITTNLSYTGLTDRYSERVSSRIQAYYLNVKVPGGDKRKKC